MKRERHLSERVDVPRPIVDLAVRRSSFAAARMMNFDFPLRLALASAYMQGMNDAIDVLSTRETSKCVS